MQGGGVPTILTSQGGGGGAGCNVSTDVVRQGGGGQKFPDFARHH